MNHNTLRPIFPKALKPGNTIAIVSPAGPTPNPQEAFHKGIQLLEAEGYRVKLMPNAMKHYPRESSLSPYLAGSDAERLSDLMAAFTDPEVNAILCARGGYGCLRIVDHLDFKTIAQHPKILVGFSDITVLLNAIYQQTGLIGFYGPMLTSNLIHQEPYSQVELFRMLCGDTRHAPALINQNPYECIHGGLAEGRLIGGNLSLLASLCGTPYQPDTRGAILFLEDWHEQIYTLDRKLTQLKLSGLLNDIAGLLFCDFSEMNLQPNEQLLACFQELTLDLKIPIGFGFSVGHGTQTGTLPLGVRAQFNADTGSLILCESPVSK